MFERFTEPARLVVVGAQEEARALRHGHIGTEHILLALLGQEGEPAARALGNLGVTAERVRAEVVTIVGSGDDVTSGQIPFTPRAKHVLEMALREALSLGHNHIGTEHILLGLIRADEGVATRILLDFGIDPDRVRNEVIGLLSGPGGPAGGATASPQLDATARQAIDLAKHEAASLGHEHVGTEHLLLGLQLSGRGLAASVLEDLGLSIERARPLLITITGSAERRPIGEAPLSPAARIAIGQATHEAVSRRAEFVGTEHLLLGVVGDYEGVLGRILLELDVKPEQIRNAVERRIAHPGARLIGTRRFPQAGLDWRRATLLWRPEGVELRVPLRMGVAAMASFAADPVWSNPPLAGLRREIWTGWLALASPTLLDDMGDPAELKRALTAAAQRALDAGPAEDAKATAFLNRLRAEP